MRYVNDIYDIYDLYIYCLGGAANITSLYNQPAQNQNVFGGGYNNNQPAFGYQAKGGNIDPFAGIGQGIGGGAGRGIGVQPANYMPRKKPDDPFAQFGTMK